MKSAAGKRGRPRSFDTSAALLRAMTLFWEKGYEATSLSDLTTAMGIAPPSLYAAFGNKEELFLAAVEEYAKTYGSYLRRALDEEPTALAAIERILLHAARQFTERGHPRGCLVICGALGTDESAVRVRKVLEDMRRAKERWMRRRIQADVDAGVLPKETDAAALARFADALLEGLCLKARLGASRRDLEKAVEVGLAALRKAADPAAEG
ncbi:MAG: TetR/AcrR family transcriptional regulator [Pseudomonadota bacterium]|nr:MAG: TetR family transcriptional regulator [Pseudomonadota bacterium]